MDDARAPYLRAAGRDGDPGPRGARLAAGADPLESSLDDAIAASRDWISVERALGIFVEPDIVRWTYARPDLLGAANWFYSHMDETLAFGAFAALRLLDPLRPCSSMDGCRAAAPPPARWASPWQGSAGERWPSR